MYNRHKDLGKGDASIAVKMCSTRNIFEWSDYAIGMKGYADKITCHERVSFLVCSTNRHVRERIWMT